MRPYPIARYIIPPIIKLWIKEATGLENLPKDGPFILAPNHSSYIEHLMIGSLVVPRLNKKLHALAKKEHFDNLLEALWHKYLAAIPLDRSQGEDALETAVGYLKKGSIIVIYPEGTRNLQLGKGRDGAAEVALQSNAPLLPVGCNGSNLIYRNDGFPFARKGKVVYRFGEALTTDKALADYTITERFALFSRESQQLYKPQFEEATAVVMKAIHELLDPAHRNEKLYGD